MLTTLTIHCINNPSIIKLNNTLRLIISKKIAIKTLKMGD